jgi:hypothetical protein
MRIAPRCPIMILGLGGSNHQTSMRSLSRRILLLLDAPSAMQLPSLRISAKHTGLARKISV